MSEVAPIAKSLVLQGAIVTAILFQFFWFFAYLAMRTDVSAGSRQFFERLAYGFPIVACIGPGIWTGLRAPDRRFAHGFYAGIAGWILTIPVSFIGIAVAASLAFRGTQTPNGLGQGEGLLLPFILVGGLVVSPVTGLVSAMMGLLRKKVEPASLA